MTTERLKELKAQYACILAEEVWNHNKPMVDHCISETAYIVELPNGDIVPIEKPRIITRFCFGYTLCQKDSEDYDAATLRAQGARTDPQYFLDRNLAELDNAIAQLERPEQSRYEFALAIKYYSQPENSKLKALIMYDRYKGYDYSTAIPLSDQDRERITEGFRSVRAKFEKRLIAYLKRYGLSKISTWTYWQDE